MSKASFNIMLKTWNITSLNVHYSHRKELREFISVLFFHSLFELLTNLLFFPPSSLTSTRVVSIYTAVLIPKLLNKGLIISNNFCN